MAGPGARSRLLGRLGPPARRAVCGVWLAALLGLPGFALLGGCELEPEDLERIKQRMQAMQLIHPMGMGRAFKILMLSKGFDPPPALSGMADPFAR